jgi:hypothetical protein
VTEQNHSFNHLAVGQPQPENDIVLPLVHMKPLARQSCVPDTECT